MSDLSDGLKLAAESIPTVVVLAEAIAKIANAKGDPAAELDALQTAAEAVKRRMDELKFPNESND